MQPAVPARTSPLRAMPRARLACVLALLAAWPLPVPANEGLEAPLYAAPTRPDRVGRMLAAVEVNGAGPYRFIIDLGANRSALSSRLAAELGLDTQGNGSVEVHGVTGSAVVPMAQVDELRVGHLVLQDQAMPVLAGAVFADADGILGVDELQESRIEVDFRNNRVRIGASDRRRAPYGYLTVPARTMYQGLLLVEGRVGDVATHVVIDTGAQYTIGNPALQEALLRRLRSKRMGSVVTGATPGVVDGSTSFTPGIRIGEARLSNVPVTFSNLHVFKLWGLADEPALIVGMDVLGTLRKFVVDYGRREFQIKTYAERGAAIDRCVSGGNCASRLRGLPN